jgi:hypothetical protein
MAVDFQIKDATTRAVIKTSNDTRWRSFATSFKKYANELNFRTSGGAGTHYMSDYGGSAHFDIAAGINLASFTSGAKVRQAVWGNTTANAQVGRMYPWVNVLKGFDTPPPAPSATGKAKGVILITGIERDHTHAQQEQFFKNGYNGTVYAYKSSTSGVAQAQAAIKNNPTFSVVLFSKGGFYSETIIDTMIAKGGNVSNFYVVEPFTKANSKTTAWKGVRYAVEKGVPSINIQTNSYVAAGYGVLEGSANPAGPSRYLGKPTRSTLRNAGSNNINHYKALTQMGIRLNS